MLNPEAPKKSHIAAIGIARSYGYECPKPSEFGTAGINWGHIGWKVDVAFKKVQKEIRPKDHIAIIRPLLPQKYSPLQGSGIGMQSVYLAEISRPFAELLAGLIGIEAQELLAGVSDLRSHKPDSDLGGRGINDWENHLERTIKKDSTITDTERTALIQARRGQGVYKQNLMRFEHSCRITKVQNPIHLIASHIKPWRDANNNERLDGENGLLLTPTVDHLFDRGFISFETNGDLVISPVAEGHELQRMGVDSSRSINVGEFTRGQRHYLEFHQDSIFLKAR